MTIKKRIIAIMLVVILGIGISGCEVASIDNYMNEAYGSLAGNKFKCLFYDSYGNLTLTVTGEKIWLEPNKIEETEYNYKGEQVTTYSTSSVVTITIDGNEIETCGDTVIFQEDGLEPDIEFDISEINSKSHGSLSDNTSVAGIINKCKNNFGKGRIVVIKDQMGTPICAYSGEKVYYTVKSNLPKTTKIMIDNKSLYIHRANFQIIDTELLDNGNN